MVQIEEGYSDGKPTIEFRHHESTVDPEAIKMWVKLLLMICEVAQDIARSDQEVAGQKESSDDILPAEKECRK
jgi:Putative amidoligase enzyme